MALNINGTTGISGVDGSVSAPALTGTDSNTGITFPSADTIKFSTGGVERMSITNSGVSGVAGITMADTWGVTTAFNGTNGDFTANWARAPYTGSTEFGGFGSAMTESSGIFTFPSNGYYYVESTMSGYANGGAINNIGLLQKFSTDSGSNYSEALKAYTSGSTDSAHFSITTSEIYDITDYANMRWKMRLESGGTCNIFGTTTGNDGLTGVRFIRLGDT